MMEAWLGWSWTRLELVRGLAQVWLGLDMEGWHGWGLGVQPCPPLSLPGVLYMPRGPTVDCASLLLNSTLNDTSYEVYMCCREQFQG